MNSDNNNEKKKQKLKLALTIAMKYFSKIFIIFGLLLFGVALVSSLGYFIVHEFNGPEKQYDYRIENKLKEDENGVAQTEEMDDRNQIIRDFYTYFGFKSQYQVNDKGELIDFDHPDAVKDEYGRENQFTLSPNMLYALDKYVYDGDFKYPEQFVKPVNADLKEFKLKDLTDKDGLLTAESKIRNHKNNKPTGETEKSVRDYGLGTIFKYTTFTTHKLVKGVYNKKDIIDPVTGEIKTVNIEPEAFEIHIPGTEQEIHLIDKVLCFAGEATFSYQEEPLKIGGFTETASENESDTSDKIIIGYANQEKTTTNQNGETVTVMERVPLYKYRDTSDPNGGIYEVKPNPVDMQKDDKGLRYFYDYFRYFDTYLPADVMKDFNLEGRIDYSSKIFDDGNQSQISESDLNGGQAQTGFDAQKAQEFAIGNALSSDAVKRTMQYLPIFKKYGQEFGVDPYILVAMVAQESGGNANLNKDGLVQINFAAGHSITATDASGQKQSLNISNSDKKNPDIAIKWMAMFMKNNMDMWNGDVLKAIQTYNFGSGTMRRLHKMFPTEAANGSWTNPRIIEQVRSAQWPGSRSANYKCCPEIRKGSGRVVGDTCYLQNVLRYYGGNNQEFKDKLNSTGGFVNQVTNMIQGLGIKFIDIVKSLIPERGEEYPIIEYQDSIDEFKADDIRKEAKTLEQSLLFSATDLSEKSIWDEGFLTSLANDLIKGDGSMVGPFAGQGGWLPPLKTVDRISSPFGWRIHPVLKTRKFHSGVDLPKPTGTPVYATKEGKVIQAGNKGNSYGIHVMIDHGGGFVSIYGHLSSVDVKAGDMVQGGQLIGRVGSTGRSTGPHLHFEVRQNGKAIDPTDIVNGKAIEAVPNPLTNMPANADKAQKLETLARSKIGADYVWGAVGPDTFDCSGFTSWVYRNALGMEITRTTRSQIEQGRPVSRAELQKGDLMFWNTVGTATHVSIYLGNGQFIHASTSRGVRIDSINSKYYGPRFHSGRRLI